MVRRVFGALLAVMLFGTSAQAATIATNQWYSFGFLDTGSALGSTAGMGFVNPSSISAPAEPWTFTLAEAGEIVVVDGFVSGDRFRLFDGSSLLGDTSEPTDAGNCWTDLTCALGDASFSSGVFALAAGFHSITGIVLNSPFEGGVAAFRVNGTAAVVGRPEGGEAPLPTPIPAALPLFGSAVAALAAMGRRRRNRAVARDR